MRRLHTYLLGVFFLTLAFFIGKTEVRAAEDITVTISVERFTLGQGYIVKPKKVTVKSGTKISQIVDTVLAEEGYRPHIDTHSSYGWYLTGIYNADTGKSRVPVSVMELAPDVFDGVYKAGILSVSENDDYPELAEFSYQMEGMSTGWFYYVNNTGPGYGMGLYKPDDQDVIRVQFTLAMGDLAKVPNIDEATRALAIMRDYLKASSDTEISAIYDDSLAIISDMDAEKDLVLQVQDLLKPVGEDLADGKKNQSYTDTCLKIREIYNIVKAHDVELRIGLLPRELTLDYRSLVEDTQGLYGALSNDQKALITSEEKESLESAVSVMEILVEEARKAKEEEDKKAASQVTSKINAIGKVTLDKETAIVQARKAYDALDADAKKMVSSTILSKLTKAESQLALLKKEEALKKKYTPPKVVLKKAKAGKKKVKLVRKKTAGATGYQIFTSAKKLTGYKKIATIKKVKTIKYTKTKLKSGKTYYFRIRAYRKVGKKVYYGSYSAVKKAKVK